MRIATTRAMIWEKGVNDVVRHVGLRFTLRERRYMPKHWDVAWGSVPMSLQQQSDLEAGKVVYRELGRLRYWLFGLGVALLGAFVIWYLWPDAWSSRPRSLLLVLLLLIILAFSAWTFAMLAVALQDALNTEQGIKDSAAALTTPGDSIQPAWDLARLSLTQSWQRNAAQNTLIFVLSVAAVVAGFIFISIGVWTALRVPASALSVQVASVVSIARVLTELSERLFLLFIGRR